MIGAGITGGADPSAFLRVRPVRNRVACRGNATRRGRMNRPAGLSAGRDRCRREACVNRIGVIADGFTTRPTAGLSSVLVELLPEALQFGEGEFDFATKKALCEGALKAILLRSKPAHAAVALARQIASAANNSIVSAQ